MEHKKHALIAMSGGVDSSVAACLIAQQGMRCSGGMMRLFEKAPLHDDTADARAVADKLGMDFYVFDARQRFCEQVMDPFVRSYECGDTPNPCIECNRHLKFGHLLQEALKLGCDYIVTGHYARVIPKEGRFLLYKAADTAKDQSYFLYSLDQFQLSHTLFPLGELTKAQVRAIADAHGFCNAGRAWRTGGGEARKSGYLLRTGRRLYGVSPTSHREVLSLRRFS